MRAFDEREWALLEESLVRLGSGITPYIFKEWLELPETNHALDELYGEGKWGLQEALTLMTMPKRGNKRPSMVGDRGRKSTIDRAAKKSMTGADRSYQAPKAQLEGDDFDFGQVLEGEDTGEPVVDVIPEEEFHHRVDARMEEYKLHFKDVTPNDEALLRTLCFVEVNIEILNQLMSREFAKPKPEGAAISRYTYALKGLMDQARNLQKDLHIDRATREREAAKMSDVDEVMSIIDSAGAWVEENGFPLLHTDCQPEGVIGKSDIQFGYMLWDFRELPVDVLWRCPRCGKRVTLHHEPSEKDLLASAQPAWVDEEEQAFAEKEKRTRGSESDEAANAE